MDLERLVVLADNKAVADAGKIGAQRREVDIRLVLADYIYGIEGIGYLIGSEHIERVVFVCDNARLNSRRRSLDLSAQACEHGAEDDDIALAAGVHNTRLLQNGILINGVFKRLAADPERGLEQLLNIRALLGILDGGGRRHTRDGQYRALGGLHDRLIGRVNSVLHSCREFLRADCLHALESAGYAAEQERQDNAGISARAAKESTGNAVGHGIDRVKLFFPELGCGLVHRKPHIRTRITVGNGENVKLVYLLSIFSKRGVSAEDHVLKHRGV